MLTKHLAVFVILVIAVTAVADDDAASTSSQKPAKIATESAEQTSPNVLPEPSVAAATTESHAPQQVLVHLQLVQINMTKLRKMGVDFTTSRADGFKNLYYDSALLEFLKWLEENNIAKVLANPEVACVSGRPASFHIGGEFRVSTGPGSSSAVDFRRHGTDANLLAKILPSGDVNLDVKLRVSQLDEGRSATIAGTQVPAVTTRELRTNVTLPDHQSAVMPGLTEERVESFVKDGHVQEETIEIRTLTTITAEIVPTVRK